MLRRVVHRTESDVRSAIHMPQNWPVYSISGYQTNEIMCFLRYRRLSALHSHRRFRIWCNLKPRCLQVMSDQQKHSDSPLNAFYAALLHGKLSLGSLGSSFGAAPTGAATKRKQGQQLPEHAKRQKEDQQNATQNPSKSPRAYQEAAQGKSNEQLCSTQRASASTAKMSDQEQKGSASSGKEAVPAWQKIDSGGSEDEGLQEDEAKRTRRKSHPSAKLSKQADKPPSSSRPEAVAVHQAAAKQQSSPAKAQNSLPSEQSVLACLQTYFPPVEGFDQAAQVGSFDIRDITFVSITNEAWN